MKKYLLLIALCLMTSVGFAQRKQATDEYHKGAVEAIPYSSMPGQMSYGYIVGEDGTNLKDGPFSIKCGLTNYKYTLSPYLVTLNGSFTVTTAYTKGKLNGAFLANYKLSVSGATILGSSKGGISNSMTGNFVNGVPNGAFKVSSNGEIKTSLTANYKNGVLVGAYSCSLFDDDAKLVQYSGTLSQNGEFIGAWKMNGRNAQFQKGVLISESDSKTSTRPAVTELSKKYAAGQITKEQLLRDHSMVVKTSKVLLGDYARVAIFRDSGVEFRKLGGYDFTIPNEVIYEYLEEVAILTDKGCEQLKKEYLAFYLENASEMECDFLSKKWVLGESTTTPYVKVYTDPKYSEIYTMIGKTQSWEVDAYIPYEKYKEMADEVEVALVAKAQTLKDFMINNNVGVGGKYVADYLSGELVAKAGQFRDADWTEVKNDVKSSWEQFNKFGESHPTNENLVVYQMRDYHGNKWGRRSYVTKNSVADYATIVENIDNDIEEVRKAALVCAATPKLQKAVEFMKANKTRSSIAFSASVGNFFYHATLSDFRLDLDSRLKLFCPIVDCEIVSVDAEKVVCKITKQGKKKMLISYEIALAYKNGKLSVESFDFANAQEVK